MQQADGGPVRQVGGRLVAASLAAAVVVALGLSLPAGHAQPATPAGAQALIAALEMPRIANVSFDCRVSSEMLDEAATPDALAAEAAALRQRTEAGEATASEWGRLAQICAQLHQGNQERAARQRAIELYRWRLETEPDSPAALSGLAEQLVHVFGWEEAEELLRSALASDPDYWPAYPLLAEALMWQSVPWTHSIAPAAVQAFTEEFAARGYSPDTLPPAAVVDEVLSELPPLEETDAAQLVTNLAAGLVSPEATDAAREAAARGRAWLEGARGRFRDRLAAEANRDAFAAWVRTELTMAMSSMGGLAAAAAAGAETPDFAADPGAAVRIVAGLQSDELLAAAQRICEQYPDDLPLRGLLGSLQALRLWADMLVRATETEAATVDAAARERAVEARDNLTPALALPGEQPVSLVVNVCAMNYLLEDLAPVEQTASTALDQGQWDWALASLYLLARLGYGPSRWADEGHPLDGHEAELPALAGELSRWVDAAQPSEPEPYGTIASLLWRGGDEAGAIKALERAHELAPDEQVYTCALGIAHLKAGRAAEAEALLAEAAGQETSDPESPRLCHRAHGAALLALGRADEALDVLGPEVTDAELACLAGLTGLEELNLPGAAVTDAGLAHLAALTSLRRLDLSATEVTDAGLAHLAALTGLEELNLQLTAVTDAGLAHLAGLTRLRSLDLTGTQIADAGLAHLAGLTALEELNLQTTLVTDAGLVHVAALKGLRHLDLGGTWVSDAGLADLSGLTGLRALDVEGTLVTDAGVAELERALPDVAISGPQ